jgi:hypothetical protein
VNQTKGKLKYEASLTAAHTNVKVESVKEDFVIQILYSTTANNNINYTTIDVPISFLILLKDFNPIVYLGLIILGVCTSLFISEYSAGSGEISKSRIIFWFVVSAVTAAIVFSQFIEQISPNSTLLTNVIIAIAFGFGAQRIISKATTRPPPAQAKPLPPGERGATPSWWINRVRDEWRKITY